MDIVANAARDRVEHYLQQLKQHLAGKYMCTQIAQFLLVLMMSRIAIKRVQMSDAFKFISLGFIELELLIFETFVENCHSFSNYVLGTLVIVMLFRKLL